MESPSGSMPPVGSGSSKASSRLANASRVAAGSEVVSIRAPSVSSATPTIPVMFTPRSASADATRASDPGRSSSLTVNQTVTARLLSSGWYPVITLRFGHDLTTATLGTLTLPAPLSRTPTKKMPDIQVFGRDDSSPTRAALRFFRERRVAVHYVDLRKRPMAPTELRRFVDRLGAAAVIDEASKPYRDAGLAYLRLDDAGIVARVSADARLLRLPLVRHANEVTAGSAEATWTAWLKRSGDG